jgi:hypothetical protein
MQNEYFPHLICRAVSCGDADHPYPVMDFNRDCIVNLLDLMFFVEYWLECTKVECDWSRPEYYYSALDMLLWSMAGCVGE